MLKEIVEVVSQLVGALLETGPVAYRIQWGDGGATELLYGPTNGEEERAKASGFKILSTPDDLSVLLDDIRNHCAVYKQGGRFGGFSLN